MQARKATSNGKACQRLKSPWYVNFEAFVLNYNNIDVTKSHQFSLIDNFQLLTPLRVYFRLWLKAQHHFQGLWGYPSYING